MNKLKLIELDAKELKEISAGGWLYDVGRWAHEKWCSFKEAVAEFADGFAAGQSRAGRNFF